MAYPIDVISVGGDYTAQIDDAREALNALQAEFLFVSPPKAYRSMGLSLSGTEYRTNEIWTFLQQYRSKVPGNHAYIIAVVNAPLSSAKTTNLFGSHDATNGLAVITLHDHKRYVESTFSYLLYYLIRYALSFVCPMLKSHRQTRGCFFDFKEHKVDLKESLSSGRFCHTCRAALNDTFSD